MTRAEKLLEESLTLSPEEREILAYELLSSVSEAAQTREWEAAWTQEVEARLLRLRAGETQALSSRQVLQNMKDHLRNRG